ncbi:MAG: DUF177 domain-containing protein [Ruminococcaceae bacterium]|nr:DUF177 domain-containing protein [Oscillospiraceae bacterium]
MVLDLKEVFERDGAAKTVSFELAISDIEIDGGHPFSSPVQVTATASNKTGIVRLNIDADFEYTRPCDRCMKELVTDMCYSFEHRLIASLCGDDDGDYIETPDYTLELDELVISDILLELPLKFLCKDDCKGLCFKCGADLNTSACSCDTRVIDPRLEALRQLLD